MANMSVPILVYNQTAKIQDFSKAPDINPAPHSNLNYSLISQTFCLVQMHHFAAVKNTRE